MKKAIVIGNGPSLKNVNMDKVKDFDTFSFNRAYLAYDDWGFYPTFYACIDVRTVLHCTDGIDKILKNEQTKKLFLGNTPKTRKYNKFPKVKLIDNRNKIWTKNPKMFGAYDIDSLPNMTKASPQCYGSVATWSVQILYALGYTHVGMIGVDCNYAKGKNNYFIKNYVTKRGIDYKRGNKTNRWNGLKKTLDETKKLKLFSCNKSSKINNIIPFLELNEFIKIKE